MFNNWTLSGQMVSFITVMATANVPPQGKGFLLFKHDQMQMGNKFVSERSFIAPLAFVLQM